MLFFVLLFTLVVFGCDHVNYLFQGDGNGKTERRVLLCWNDTWSYGTISFGRRKKMPWYAYNTRWDDYQECVLNIVGNAIRCPNMIRELNLMGQYPGQYGFQDYYTNWNGDLWRHNPAISPKPEQMTISTNI